MQEQTTFSLSSKFSTESANNVTAAIRQEIELNVEALKNLLVSYHYKSRGRVLNVSIVENSIELINPLMAKFMVRYAVGQFNACADVDFTENASMEILIDIEPDELKAIITGEYIPEREPDEF
jgi:hypothetical protein